MEYATPRQVHTARRIMERYIKARRIYALPYTAQRFVRKNSGATYTVSVTQMKQMEKSEMSRLLDELRGAH